MNYNYTNNDYRKWEDYTRYGGGFTSLNNIDEQIKTLLKLNFGDDYHMQKKKFKLLLNPEDLSELPNYSDLVLLSLAANEGIEKGTVLLIPTLSKD